MERGGDKVNPRLDEQLKHETAPITHGAGVEGHSRDDLRQEPTDEVPDDFVDRRAELAKVLAPVQFPATREQLVAAVTSEFAPEVAEELRGLHDDGPFENVQEVWAALGGLTEETHTGHRQDEPPRR